MKRIRLFKTIALLAIAFFAVAMGSAQAGKIPVTFAGTEAATTTQSKMM